MTNNLQHRIRLIAGLGNPGNKYANTRHNAGFIAVDRLVQKLRGVFVDKSYHNALVREGKCKGTGLVIVKPLTFMNASGEAVELIARKHQLIPEEILVVYDDMDLPLGRIRIRDGGGSSGGHKGVESVQLELASADFIRVRIGIGRGKSKVQIDHVLSEFTDSEKELFDKAVDQAADAIKLVLYRGLAEAMNTYNGKNIEK